MEHSIDDLILYRDDQLVVINKPSGILVQADPSGSSNINDSLEQRLGQEVYLVNRLDRPVSGAVLFALSKNQYNLLKNKWKEKETLKIYMGIVEGKWDIEDKELIEKLIKGRNRKAVIHPKGKRSSMVINAYPIFDHYSLCTIQLYTGRFHQIRAMLSHHNYPIKGDVKYGARRKNHNRSIHLHCYRLSVPGIIDIKAPFPGDDVLWKKAEEFLLEEGL